jgi:hypothetical protein
MFETPVAFFIYRRPEATRRVFAEIARIKPTTLLVVADGPKSETEQSLCDATRQITERIDWDCRVIRNYAPANMGCRSRMASGFDWVFEQVEEAILLEDDCVPDPSFFRFCQELLIKYRDDERVGAILGTSFIQPNQSLPYDYFFSRYFSVAWGWASWRRAWKQYDVAMKQWPAAKESSLLHTIWQNADIEAYWANLFDKTYDGRIDTWDYQWFFAWWTAGLLNAIPAKNLISNIGFDDGATHAQGPDSSAFLETYSLHFPLKHPPHVKHDMAGSRDIYQLYLKKAKKGKRIGRHASLLNRVYQRFASLLQLS